VCGRTGQAVGEAAIAAELRYDAGLLSLGAWAGATDDELIAHCREVASVIPSSGSTCSPRSRRVLPETFWRRFLEIPEVVAIKVAPFDRYRTLDVARALAASGREHEVALYTGNDDSIVAGPPDRPAGGGGGARPALPRRPARPVGGVDAASGGAGRGGAGRAGAARAGTAALLARGAALTDANAALFDAAHRLRRCLPGIHEALRRQGLLLGRWCLDEREELSPGQMEEIDRVHRRYPQLRDDEFVAAHLEEWLR